MDRLTGFHAVREALESGRALERILVARGRHGERVEEIVASAREHGVPVRFEEPEHLDRLPGTAQHQAVLDIDGPTTALRLQDLRAIDGVRQEGCSCGIVTSAQP
jgi:23S rRNA (guanosine2251-2'-O)-methyltransferase